MKRKRIAAAILVCLMIAVSCGALALDLSAYEVGQGDLLLEYRTIPKHTAAIERSGEDQQFVIYDEDGKQVYRESLGSRRSYDVAESADHPDGGYLAVLLAGTMDGGETMILRRIGEDGQRLWDAAIPKGFSYNWTVLCGDGQGGAFFVFADPHDYKLAQVWRFDAQGEVCWNRVIEAEDLIFSHFSGRFDAQKDRLVIGGHAVSKSRGVYDALVLEIDREGNLTVAQRKDFSCRPDYGFDVLMDESGAFYAHSRAGYLDTTGTLRLLVPLDALPDAPQRRVSLKEEPAPDVYYYNTDGGRKFHVSARCHSIDPKYYDSMQSFASELLGEQPYCDLQPCGLCGADLYVKK